MIMVINSKEDGKYKVEENFEALKGGQRIANPPRIRSCLVLLVIEGIGAYDLCCYIGGISAS